jgi:hypothetical protein
VSDRETCLRDAPVEREWEGLSAMSLTWRVARSLDVLLGQINELAPNRDKASDGSICDTNHSPDSDHCPHDIAGLGENVVTARDFDHDPANGADMGEISETLRLSRDPRIAYVIFNRRIFSATSQPWTWRTYTGTNPHSGHMHVSVIHYPIADDTTQWRITMPLTNDDIKRVSDATAAKVLGKPWALAGRTLAGSVEALLNYHPLVMAELQAISEDVTNDVQFTDEQLRLISERLAERLPTEGTFALIPRQEPAP